MRDSSRKRSEARLGVFDSANHSLKILIRMHWHTLGSISQLAKGAGGTSAWRIQRGASGKLGLGRGASGRIIGFSERGTTGISKSGRGASGRGGCGITEIGRGACGITEIGRGPTEIG